MFDINGSKYFIRKYLGHDLEGASVPSEVLFIHRDLFKFGALNVGKEARFYYSYGHLSVISTKKTPFTECIIPFITTYNW